MNTVASRAFTRFSLSVLLALSAVATRAESMDTLQASWQSQELTFHYSSFETWYNCNSFEDKLEKIFRQLGARDDVKVRTSGCYGSDQVGNMLTSRIKVAMPAASDAHGEAFAAGYRTVTLRADQWNNVGMGDCELLEQLQRQLLPKLKLQNTNDIRCTPGNAMNGRQSLDVRALIAVPDKAK